MKTGSAIFAAALIAAAIALPAHAQGFKPSKPIEFVTHTGPGGGGDVFARGITAAAALKPRPGLVVVLTDGYTPWPAGAPRGVAVVVGLIGAAAPNAPAWARSVRIDD